MHFKLCYVEGGRLWFTSCPLDKQTGDDWNDVPYEHNAGQPYEWQEHTELERYEVKWGYFMGLFLDPAEFSNRANSPWSVDMINTGIVPWLRSSSYPFSGQDVKIFAGESPAKVASKIISAGGELWVPLDKQLVNPEEVWLQDV